MIYDYIYDFYLGLFNSQYLQGYSATIMGQNTSLPMWLSHTASIISLCLLLALLFLIIRWAFRVFAGLWNRI